MCPTQFFLFLLLLARAAAAAQDCPTSCGNITIPYPFGIGEACAWPGFDLTCNESFLSPKTFLTTSTVEITAIDLQQGQVILNMSRAKDCYDASNRLSDRFDPWAFLGQYPDYPYFYSADLNIFAAVGCDTLAVINDRATSDYITGCITVCSRKDSVVDGPCSGIGCCQIPDIPSGLKNVTITVRSFSNHSGIVDFNPCSYAFLVDSRWFKFRASDISADSIYRDSYEYVPVVLDWSVANRSCEEARKNVTDYACKSSNSFCEASTGSAPGYLCRCDDGYQGNPYVVGGCTDVDECRHKQNYSCYGDCINSEGGHICSCPKGMRGNPKVEGGCYAGTPVLKIALGVGIPSAVVIVLIVCGGIIIHRRIMAKIRETYFKENGGEELKGRIERDQEIEQNLRVFTNEELEKATNKFDQRNVLGRGGQGEVFRGNIPDRSSRSLTVAIKKSLRPDALNNSEFINEVIILSQIKHTNVVKLLGCCLERENPLLVYEFVPRGTLFDYIRHNSMSWRERIKIALGTASGLAHLHSKNIVHGDVKSQNVLLGEDLTAKVSDFGTSRLTPAEERQINTLVKGTVGYLDPEYLQTQQLTDKSDVYSFGVVVLELLTRRPPVPLVSDFLSYRKVSGSSRELLDRSIVERVAPDQVDEVEGIAEWCLKMKGEDRPTVAEVASKLEDLMCRIPYQESDDAAIPLGGASPPITPGVTAPLTKSMVGSGTTRYSNIEISVRGR